MNQPPILGQGPAHSLVTMITQQSKKEMWQIDLGVKNTDTKKLHTHTHTYIHPTLYVTLVYECKKL